MLHVLPGGADTGEALVADPLVRVISFTGSTRAGRAVGELAAQHLKRVHLELGGNSALLVLDDVDVDAASSVGAWGSFAHQGQVCMTTGRHLVMSSIADEYVAALSARADHLPVGDPTTGHGRPRPGDRRGPARQDPRHGHRIGRARAPGSPPEARTRTSTTGPTVLDDVPLTSTAYPQEIFGPVAPVVRVDSVDEAIALARDSDYGLSLGILTRDVMRGLEIAEQIPSGLVHINDQTINDEATIPFGGVGSSGTGARLGGAAGQPRGVHRHPVGHRARHAAAVPVLARPGLSRGRGCARASAPDLGGGLDDERELGDLLVDGQRVALDRRGEAALRREAELVERHVASRPRRCAA